MTLSRAAAPRPSPRTLVADLLTGRRLEYVRLDGAIVCGFSGAHQLVMETRTHLTGPDGHHTIAPRGRDGETLTMLLGDVIHLVRVGLDGELAITFTSGLQLLVDADTHVESWAVTGPNKLLIVCLAGGELAVWDSGDSSAASPYIDLH